MNWGKGIFVVMSAFIVFILVLTTIMMTRGIDLESEDYYKKEIVFEQEIQAINNANNLEENILIKKNASEISFDIPSKLSAEKIKVDFFRPNNKDLDRSFRFKKGEFNTIPIGVLQKGKYHVEISYFVDGKPCLQKDEITI